VGSYQPVEGIKFDIGRDKDSAEARVARGVKVGSLAPASPLYQEPEIKAGVDAVMLETSELEGGMARCAAAAVAYKKARVELNALLAAWDRSYELLLAAGAKHCATAGEGAGLGLSVRPKTSYAFAPPLGIALKHNVLKGTLRIHVQRAPGTHSLCVQVSRDPSEPAGWTELEGGGAIHELPSPAPGTWWVRAASRSAKQRSAFTEPVSVLVR
jgi:hypothetical protein